MNATIAPHAPLAVGERQPTDDERMGMIWYNGLTRHERSTVLAAADKVLGKSGKSERI